MCIGAAPSGGPYSKVGSSATTSFVRAVQGGKYVLLRGYFSKSRENTTGERIFRTTKCCSSVEGSI